MLGFTLFLFLIFGFSQPSEARSDAALSLPIPYPTQPDVSPTDFWHTSRYLTMRDGVKIAIDLYLPKQHQESKEFPAILHQTRYWRSVDYRWPVSVLKGKRPRGLIDTYAKRFLANGYAWVDMDVRGSGASFGSRRYAYSPEEIRDGNEVVDWIIQQPWSNGKVGALGISYGGTAAELLLVNQHPAVKAVAPLFSGFDLYSEIVFPGGIHLTWFTKTWSFITNQLDHNDLPYANWFTNLFVRGVLPINGDSNQTLLKQAIQEHEHNWNPHQEALGITFRDDVPPSQVTTSLDLLSPQTFGPEIAKSGAAIYSYSGWFDGAYQLAAIKRHWTHQNHANKLILGPWDHGGKRNISPFNLSPSQFDHQGELLKFFDFHLKGWNTSIIHERPVHYFTMGEERWKATDSWPPPSSQLAFYLAPQRTLTEDFPTTPLPPDRYQVDPSNGTGTQSRWNTLIGQSLPQPYSDRSVQDQTLLSYTSPRLDCDLEVTGHPIATLYLSATTTDTTVFAYLEDIDEQGQVTYVTEGLLRALHRKLSNPPAGYPPFIPHRSFKRKDALSLHPGEVFQLVFDLFPTSYQFKKGHQIRLSLAGTDRDHFAQPIGKTPALSFYHTPRYPSHLVLPTPQEPS